MKKKYKFSIIIFTLHLIVSPSVLFGQIGSLDLSFGNNGIVTTSIELADDLVFASALQDDGKIVVAGSTNNGNNYDFALARYNTNGSLDNTFGNNGKVTTALGTLDDRISAIAIQSDGKIVVAGSSNNGNNSDFALARYNTNGSLDSTFGNDGIITTPILNSDTEAKAIIIQNDGKIVVAGNALITSTTLYMLTRYNTNGSLDNSFDNDGIVTTNISSESALCYAIAIQIDNKIVIGGYVNVSPTDRSFSLVRYNTDGSLDLTFDTDGKVTTSLGVGYDEIRGIVIQSDGKIVAAGFTDTASNDNYNIGVIRYNSNGSVDTSFGTNGIVNEDFLGSVDLGTSIILQSDNKILIGGSSIGGIYSYDFALLRLNNNGSVDNTFGNNGKITTPIGGLSIIDQANSVLIQSDNKIILAGYTGFTNNYNFAITRYNNDVLGINSSNYISTELKISPNPFNNITTLNSSVFFNDVTINVFNTLGQLVKQLKNISGETILFNRDKLNDGIYLIQLCEKNKEIVNVKIIVN